MTAFLCDSNLHFPFHKLDLERIWWRRRTRLPLDGARTRAMWALGDTTPHLLPSVPLLGEEEVVGETAGLHHAPVPVPPDCTQRWRPPCAGSIEVTYSNCAESTSPLQAPWQMALVAAVCPFQHEWGRVQAFLGSLQSRKRCLLAMHFGSLGIDFRKVSAFQLPPLTQAISGA